MPPKRVTRRSERRRNARADARLSMRLEGRHTAGDATQVVTESQNISSSGVYCTSTHYLAPLSKVALTIVLPGFGGTIASKELIKCDGIVVRCDPVRARGTDPHYELACMFSNLDSTRRTLIEEFVTLRNLQALRTATTGPNGARKGAAATAGRKGTTRRPAAKRRTVH